MIIKLFIRPPTYGSLFKKTGFLFYPHTFENNSFRATRKSVGIYYLVCYTNINMLNRKIKIAWVGKHFGEEPPLGGEKNQGAGGIFFSGCNLKCVFCQNWQISQTGIGQEYSAAKLAEMMLKLQTDGPVNIDLVTPTIWWQEIKTALQIAKSRGLTLPILWNSNAYEQVATLKQLAGLVDIYLPDFKYGDDAAAFKYSGVRNYAATATAAIKEMLSQVGHLQTDENGIATRGVIVRHLILPNNIQNSLAALKILRDIDPQLPISLMRQYYPLHNARNYPEINRQISEPEFMQVFDYLWELGLTSGWVQEKNCEQVLIPDFNKPEPFKL